ncbi:hypothetical protein KQX54_005611 [Cotesia glomerata]|uniref:Uncharacterized protein n=1 Tax=Cotesia glomerata TaxID=32391 RepID=A0AAV7I2I8_COTGL|nr:hypothetical protein KQX54_005611 [Cotesia glomerata]
MVPLRCTITLRVEYWVGSGRRMCVLDLGCIFMGTDAWKWFEGLIYSNAEIRVIWIRNKTLVLTFKFRATCLSTSRENIPSRYFPLLNPCFELLDVCVLTLVSDLNLSCPGYSYRRPGLGSSGQPPLIPRSAKVRCEDTYQPSSVVEILSSWTGSHPVLLLLALVLIQGEYRDRDDRRPRTEEIQLEDQNELDSKEGEYADDLPPGPPNLFLLLRLRLRDTAVSISRPRPKGSLRPPSSLGSFGQTLAKEDSGAECQDT